MKKVILVAFFLAWPLCAFADQLIVDPPDDQKKSDTVPLFSFETDDKSASDSLNRVAGDIDLGFAAPSQTYKSPNQKNALIDRDQTSNPVE